MYSKYKGVILDFDFLPALSNEWENYFLFNIL